MSAVTGTMKRYPLVLPEAVYDRLQAIADREGTTFVDVVRRFLKMGLVLDAELQSPDAKLVIRSGGEEQVVKII
jgi:hypothetical protein